MLIFEGSSNSNMRGLPRPILLSALTPLVHPTPTRRLAPLAGAATRLSVSSSSRAAHRGRFAAPLLSAQAHRFGGGSAGAPSTIGRHLGCFADKRGLSTSEGDVSFDALEAAGIETHEGEYNERAEEYLCGLEDALEVLEDHVDAFDLTYADGVMTVDLGDHGIYVLNKQRPNRQIWWSSPLSGPKRYHFERATGQWIDVRDGSSMLALLRDELADLLGADVADDLDLEVEQ